MISYEYKNIKLLIYTLSFYIYSPMEKFIYSLNILLEVVITNKQKILILCT